MAEEDRLPIAVNAAIQVAKAWLKSVYADEQISNLGLEEIWHDRGHWKVTLGFSRPWDSKASLQSLAGGRLIERSLKTVTVDDITGEVSSVVNRELPRQ